MYTFLPTQLFHKAHDNYENVQGSAIPEGLFYLHLTIVLAILAISMRLS